MKEKLKELRDSALEYCTISGLAIAFGLMGAIVIAFAASYLMAALWCLNKLMMVWHI